MFVNYRFKPEPSRLLSDFRKWCRFAVRRDMTIATLCLALLMSIASLAAAGNEPPPSFGILLSGGPSVALGRYAEDYSLGVHGGGGIQIRLSLQETHALSLILRLDYFRYPYEYVFHYYYPLEYEERHEHVDNHIAVEVGLMMTFLNHSKLRPYGSLGVGLREVSPEVVATMGADLAFVSSEGFIPFLEFRATKATLSSLQFDLGVRMGS